MAYSKCQPSSLEIMSKNLDRLIFKLKLSKRASEVANISIITCSITSAYLGKMWVQFLKLPFWKCNENTDFLFKNTHEKERVSFCLKKDIFCYACSFGLHFCLMLSLFSKIMPWIKYTTTNRTYHPVNQYICIYNIYI